MGSSDSHKTEDLHSHPIELFQFNVSSLLEGFLEKWVDLYCGKGNNHHVLAWCLHHQIPGELGRVRPDLQLRGSSWGSLQGRGSEFFPNPSLGGFAVGRGWLGSSGEEMQHHFSEFLLML